MLPMRHTASFVLETGELPFPSTGGVFSSRSVSPLSPAGIIEAPLPGMNGLERTIVRSVKGHRLVTNRGVG